MQRYISAILLSVLANCLCAQTNISTPMTFHIEKDVIPPVLNIVPNTVELVDPNNNNVIDGGEVCKIRFEVANTGKGDAFGCVAKVQANGTTEGLIIEDINLRTIPKNSKQWIEIPIKATEKAKTGQVTLSMYVDEPNGYGTEQISYIIGTHKMRTPLLEVVSYRTKGDTGGKLERRQPFKLQVAVQNTDQGAAVNAIVALKLPNNVNWIGGDEKTQTFTTIEPNETKIFEYELMANQNAAEEIPIEITLSEQTGRYAKNATIPLQLGQYLGSSIAMNIERKDKEVDIKKVSLISDVDENIPLTKSKNINTFVLIIANEKYQQVASVPFALNDGRIFNTYCEQTLGVDPKKIHYVPNATGNQIKTQINWLQTVIEVFDNPNIIFYYAGHGIPDEKSRTAYLLPVDGVISDLSTCYKLDDLYTTLGELPAGQISVFMDACFSGSKRENGMLASARGVALKARPGMPQGNMVVFSAAQGDETAYPYSEQQHGMFTYYLLKKLQETKGDVTLQELGDYIVSNVKQQSLLENNRIQTPSVTPASAVTDEWKNWTLK